MRTILETLTNQIERVETLEDLHQVILDLRGVFDVSNAVYHSVKLSGEPYALVTYSNDWSNYYQENTLYRIDPVVLSAFQRFHPYNWKSLSWDSKPAKELYANAVAAGVGNQGISLPIRGPDGEFAVFSVSHQCSDTQWAQFIARERQNLMLVGHFLHQAARRIEAPEQEDVHKVILSPRESDVLRLLGAGHNRARIADQLDISEHTLRVYIESARSKLGAANTVHAVAKALSKGAISL